MTAHWGMPAPAAVQGSEKEHQRALRDTFMMLQPRIDLFACLPLEKLDRLSLQKSVREIGQT